MKKNLNKPILKAARKRKALSDEVPEDITIDKDKGYKANFWGWIRYFWREYANGMDEEASGDSLKEGTNFVVGVKDIFYIIGLSFDKMHFTCN